MHLQVCLQPSIYRNFSFANFFLKSRKPIFKYCTPRLKKQKDLIWTGEIVLILNFSKNFIFTILTVACMGKNLELPQRFQEENTVTVAT